MHQWEDQEDSDLAHRHRKVLVPRWAQGVRWVEVPEGVAQVARVHHMECKEFNSQVEVLEGHSNKEAEDSSRKCKQIQLGPEAPPGPTSRLEGQIAIHSCHPEDAR